MCTAWTSRVYQRSVVAASLSFCCAVSVRLRIDHVMIKYLFSFLNLAVVNDVNKDGRCKAKVRFSKSKDLGFKSQGPGYQVQGHRF